MAALTGVGMVKSSFASEGRQMTDDENSVKLDCRLSTSGPQELNVEYRLINSGTDIYVLDNILNRLDGSLGPDPRRAYTLIGDHSELVLLKGLLPVPEGVQVELPEVPYANFVNSKSSIGTSFAVPRTLPYDNPYDYEARREVIVIRHAILRIGYVPAEAVAGRGQEIKIRGKTFFRFRYRDLIGWQRFIECPLGEVDLQLHT